MESFLSCPAVGKERKEKTLSIERNGQGTKKRRASLPAHSCDINTYTSLLEPGRGRAETSPRTRPGHRYDFFTDRCFSFSSPPPICVPASLSLSPPPWFLIAAVGGKGWDSSSSVTCVCNALVRLFLHFSSRLIYFVCFLFLLILSPFRVCCSQKFVTVCGQPSVSAAIRSGPLRLNGAAVNVKMRVEE